MFKRLLLVVGCLLLAACGRQPDVSTLRTDIGQRLDATYGEGVFKIVELDRKGSATDSTAPEGEDRRVVYYDIALEFEKDVTLDAWDRPGVASLVTLLGAGPRSISGVKSGGNLAGDQIIAHASAIYAKNAGGQWVLATPPGVSNAQAPAIDTGAPPPVSRRLLDTLDEISRSVTRSNSGAGERIVQQELQRSVARINGRLSRMQQGYPLAGGPDRGEYVAFASALAALAHDGQAKITPLITGGSVDNIEMLRTGDAVIALAQADAADMAYEGEGPFYSKGPFTNLRALGGLYPELVHIVVRDDPAYRGVRSLKGKKVALGPAGSAVRTTLEHVLDAHGLQAGKDYTAVDMPFTASLPALTAGVIDATVHVIGIPATPLRDALAKAPLKLLPLDAAAIEALVEDEPSLMPLNIAQGVYPNQTKPVATVGMAALLLTTTALTRDEAIELTQRVFQAGYDLLAYGSAQGAQVSAASARMGVTVPLHDGADEALSALGNRP
ncbi:TAXI family TRAP transporter solute-binding subunit [Pusillimonas minor]|uniref:TAXI family TRAP transporter solute-binding subunit n=1 Tax=Pusillimonas minor TaxID=2697024 RepID=A0A842HSC1_9BURK|nr:TAXI family TRAP transporter solute-binding subunit [Pusillimonas minor]MBC2770131.1 TAXI family TRAP transporter solute-binding subunit [Pusillimonas minor]